MTDCSRFPSCSPQVRGGRGNRGRGGGGRRMRGTLKRKEGFFRGELVAKKPMLYGYNGVLVNLEDVRDTINDKKAGIVLGKPSTSRKFSDMPEAAEQPHRGL
ncbi:UNVERIFIED_CONTAM: hypothetical protein Sradi_3873800 [Sesamum radiatum]|uniref:Uncharacterized protein n=1 Tax=Sesamum radiatum TaxID=300843 RepID=A0AAW2Q2D8_SESRA